MNIRRPLFWHEGLFLQPQHLQYTDLCHMGKYYPLQQIANPFFWGIIRFRLNEGALSHDMLEPESCEFLMPGGELINYPDDSVISSRSFSSAWEDRQAPFTIYAGIRKLNPKGSNVTIISHLNEASEAVTRFVTLAEPQEMPDLYQDGPDAMISPLTYVLKLFWESELEELHDYELLPIIQLIQDGDEIRLSQNFVPPCLYISSSKILLKTVTNIRDELAGRIRQLEEHKTTFGTGNAEIAARSLPFRFALQLLSQYAPIMFHYTDTLTVHPWMVYGTLRQLIGGISALSDQVNFAGETKDDEALLPPYNHNEIGKCFLSAYRLIVRLLNEMTMGAEYFMPMEYDSESGQFSTDIPDILFESNHIFYLSLRTETPIEEFLDMFMSTSKIGSIEQVKYFAEHALPGIKIIHLMVQPEGIPRKPNATYFRIDRRDIAWNAIQNNKNIAVIWDNAPEQIKIELIAVRR